MRSGNRKWARRDFNALASVAMNPERYQQIKRVLMAALDLPEAERHRYIAAQCGGDTELHRDVEELLAGQAQSSFLEHSPTGLGPEDDESDSVGTQLGRIKLDRLIARGGMGRVRRRR